jgi:glucan phosphoethanolaminetransferase (alkaline phosphatase superfamily)
MTEYLNLIQIITGVLAAILIFVGIFLSAKKLNPEKYEVIPVKTTVISTLLIILGLLSYAVTKMCTNMNIVTEEHYELWALYFASLEEVIKLIGFIVFIPVLFRLFKPRSRKEKPAEEEITGEDQES